MASFTDAIPQFNPYIQQLPVEAMVTVGMEKQQRYDQGIQRIQSQIDQVAGLSIVRPQDKEYLQSKLNELGTKLKTVAAGDFSNYQLVNSVAGMASTIMKDPVVLAGVQSTQNIKNNEKLMEEARQKNELNPANLDFYNKKLSAYESSPLVDEKGKPIVFNAKYDPFFDVDKFTRETFEAVKPDGFSYDEIFTKDEKGNTVYSPTMTRLKKEGRFPQKVKETIDQIFSDPRVAQQLQITGEYNYKGYSPEMMKQKISTQESAVLAAQNFQIAELTLSKNGAKTDEQKKQIDDQIAKIQSSISRAKEQYNSLKEAADSNPDGVRGFLHEDDVRNRYTTMFGYITTTEEKMSNPGWESNYKMQQAAFDRQKFYTQLALSREQFAFDKQKHRDGMMMKELELAQQAANNSGGQWELGDVLGKFDILAHFNQDYERTSENFVNSSKEFIWEGIYSDMDGNEARFQKLINAGNTREKAIDIILKQDAEKQGLSELDFTTIWTNKAVQKVNSEGGIVRDDLLMAYNSYTSSKRGLEDIQVTKDQVDGATASQTDQAISKILSGDGIKPQTIKFRGKDILLSKQDIVDLGVYSAGYKHVFGFAIDDGVKQAANEAYKRLEKNGKSNIADYMMRRADIGDSNVLSEIGGFFGSPGMFNITGAISRSARQLGSPFETLRDDWDLAFGDIDFDFSQVEKVFNTINTDKYPETLSTKAEILKNVYDINANLKSSLLTGNAEADRNIVSNVQRLAGAYAAAGQNASSTFGDFSKIISGVTDPKDLNLEVEAYDAGGGQPQFIITAYGDGDKASMIIQADEASRFNLTNPYVSNSVSLLGNRITSRGGKTSYENPNEFNTYINGDAYFQKTRGDFPNLVDSQYNVMANITNSNGMYYGKIFTQDPATGKVAPIFTTPPGDLETIYNSVRGIDDTFVRSLIFKK